MTSKKAKKAKNEKTPQDVDLRQPNRTGVQASPVDAQAQKEAVDRFPPSSPGDGSPLVLHALCLEDERRAAAIGTMPAPGTMKGAAKAMMQAVMGQKETVLIDKLADRMAFERAGTRLYEGLLVKLEANGSFDGGPSRDDIAGFLDEELAHFHQVKEAIEKLGADPTALTPSANVTAAISQGLPLVILDPHTNLAQALHAIHVAELADNDGWQMLIALCDFMGHEDLAVAFRRSLAEEDVHLDSVRRWLTSYASGMAKREVPERGAEAGVAT